MAKEARKDDALPLLPPALASFRAAALAGRISSSGEYLRRYRDVARTVRLPVGAPVTYEVYVEYACRTWGVRHCAGTLVSYLSSVASVLRDLGDPLPRRQEADLYRMLDGLRAQEAGRAPRAALDREKSAVVEAELRAQGRVDLAEGLNVLGAIMGRQQDIEGMTADRVRIEARSVMCGNKLPLYKKKELGELEAHTVLYDDALEILARRVKAAGEGKLFPRWNPRLVGEAVKACARANGWPDNLVWDGTHTARHGAAAGVKEVCLRAGVPPAQADQVVQGLAWKSRASKRYAVQERDACAPKVPGKKGVARAVDQKAGAGGQLPDVERCTNVAKRRRKA
jgi:hypothetical protein